MVDTQVVELAGRHYLIAQLLAGGVEVAVPVRDKGIDLIAYIDVDAEDSTFYACPIQMKANREERFVLHQKYASIPNLLMAYVWHVESESPEIYALTYTEAISLLSDRGHTDTRSWNQLGSYSLTVNEAWRERLAPFRMVAGDWRNKIRQSCSRAERLPALQSLRL